MSNTLFVRKENRNPLPQSKIECVLQTVTPDNRICNNIEEGWATYNEYLSLMESVDKNIIINIFIYIFKDLVLLYFIFSFGNSIVIVIRCSKICIAFMWIENILIYSTGKKKLFFITRNFCF